MLTQERLKELFTYDPCSGLFCRTKRSGKGNSSPKVGTMTKYGYIRIAVDKKYYMAHRLAWLYMHGEWPSDQIDHINHKRSDNRLDNLRSVSRRENMKNQTLRITNSSGVIGVNWHKNNSAWNAQIMRDGVKVNLGYYDLMNDAIIERKMAEYSYGYHENHGGEF